MIGMPSVRTPVVLPTATIGEAPTRLDQEGVSGFHRLEPPDGSAGRQHRPVVISFNITARPVEVHEIRIEVSGATTL